MHNQRDCLFVALGSPNDVSSIHDWQGRRAANDYWPTTKCGQGYCQAQLLVCRRRKSNSHRLRVWRRLLEKQSVRLIRDLLEFETQVLRRHHWTVSQIASPRLFLHVIHWTGKTNQSTACQQYDLKRALARTFAQTCLVFETILSLAWGLRPYSLSKQEYQTAENNYARTNLVIRRRHRGGKRTIKCKEKSQMTDSLLNK